VLTSLVGLKISILNVLHLIMTFSLILIKRAVVIQWLSYELIPMILGSVLTFTTNLENISQNNKFI